MNLLKKLPFWHFATITYNGEDISIYRMPYFKKILAIVSNLSNLNFGLSQIVEDIGPDEEWQNDLQFFSINVSREFKLSGEERMKICFSWTAREVNSFSPEIYLESDLKGDNIKVLCAIGKPIQIERFAELITRTLIVT